MALPPTSSDQSFRRTTLIVCLGAVPALAPGYLAIAGTCSGLAAMPSPLPRVQLIWGTAGLVGVVSLWLAAFYPVNPVVGSGLAFAVLAILSLSVSTRTDSPIGWMSVGTLLPLVTAAVLLAGAARSGAATPGPTIKQAVAWLAFAACLATVVLLVAFGLGSR